MIPEKTDWTNIVMGENQPGVLPCPARRDPEDGNITIQWDLTDEEVEAIVKTRKILAKHYTGFAPMQPVQLWVADPTGEPIKDDRIPD